MNLKIPPAPLYHKRDFFSARDIPLRIIGIEDSPEYPPHSHDFIELVFVEAGTGIHLMNGARHEIKPGDIYLVDRTISHGYFDTNGLAYTNVVFDERLLSFGSDDLASSADEFGLTMADEAPGGRREHVSMTVLKELKAISNAIDRELVYGKPGYKYMAIVFFLQLWGTLTRGLRQMSEDDASAESRVRTVIESIREDPSIDKSAGELADEAKMCPRHFHRIFRRLTGASPIVFVNEMRIEKAKALLEGTDKAITQIAFLVGYQDANYFTRTFHGSVGCPPREYRNRSKPNESFRS